MIIRSIVVSALLILAACASSSDPPLPVVHASDPVWPLQPDHLQYGSLPR